MQLSYTGCAEVTQKLLNLQENWETGKPGSGARAPIQGLRVLCSCWAASPLSNQKHTQCHLVLTKKLQLTKRLTLPSLGFFTPQHQLLNYVFLLHGGEGRQKERQANYWEGSRAIRYPFQHTVLNWIRLVCYLRNPERQFPFIFFLNSCFNTPLILF